MLTRIELINFMSHKHTVIEPAAGLTVLVGPNNVGKSAIVAALQILCHNENSTYVMRHGEKQCRVLVETADGHVIQWRRKNAPSYEIDGQKFDRLRGSGLPEELHQALKLGKVDGAGDADFDIHFGRQKSPIFLLDGSAANAARFFASSSDAIRLVAMQKRHKEKHAEAKRDKIRLEAESARLNAELKSLEPVVEIDKHVAAAERDYDALRQAEAALVNAQHHLMELQAQTATRDHLDACANALAPLRSPPAMHDVPALARHVRDQDAIDVRQRRCQRDLAALQQLREPPALADAAAIARLIEQLSKGERNYNTAEKVAAATARLLEPPVLSSDVELSQILTSIAQNQASCGKWQAQLDALAANCPPPVPIATDELAGAIKQLELVAKEASDCKQKLDEAARELAAADNDLRGAVEGSLCPTCGGQFDADRFVARVAAGLGGHTHE